MGAPFAPLAATTAPPPLISTSIVAAPRAGVVTAPPFANRVPFFSGLGMPPEDASLAAAALLRGPSPSGGSASVAAASPTLVATTSFPRPSGGGSGCGGHRRSRHRQCASAPPPAPVGVPWHLSSDHVRWCCSFRAALDSTHPTFDLAWGWYPTRDGSPTRGCGCPRVPDPLGAGVGVKLHPWVHPHPHP
jgi:hypothetical protein